MKFFAAVFSIFCLHLLQSTEAKADTSILFGDASPHFQLASSHIESSLPVISNAARIRLSTGNWLPFLVGVLVSLSIFLFETDSKKKMQVSYALSARAYEFRSGLSPPHLRC